MSELKKANLIKVGALARMLKVTPRTVRFYEDMGLIRPSSRTSGGFRLYSEEQVERFRAVLALKEIGFTLEEIRDYQATACEGEIAFDVMSRLRGSVSAGLSNVKERIKHLERAMEDLSRTDEILSRCTGCDEKALDADCFDCLKEFGGGTLPSCLKAVMR